MKVDLHMHSQLSDGEFSPEALALKCVEKKIEYACLTDHDTVKGVKTFLNCCNGNNVKAVSGIELSTMANKKEIHVLGYNFNFESREFLKELTKIQEMRQRRNSEIISKLKKYKIYINKPESENGETIGRMHIARALKKAGYVLSENEAFDKWLAFGKPAYVSSERIDTVDAIRTIKRSGGTAVLAHPYLIPCTFENLIKYIKELKSCGLDGVETYYAKQNKFQQEQMEQFANTNGLIQTAGSDFHGSGRMIEIGDCDGEKVTDEYLKKIGFSVEK